MDSNQSATETAFQESFGMTDTASLLTASTLTLYIYNTQTAAIA